VAASDVEAAHAFCAAHPEIEAGYLCSVEAQPDAWKAPRRALQLAVTFGFPVTCLDDIRPQLRALTEAFAKSHPDLTPRIGFGILSDRAVPSWERYGVRVFIRSAV
jgi:hypothetical protein